MLAKTACCDNLFRDFIYEDIRHAAPPLLRGVYTIRVRQRGQDVSEILTNSEKLLATLDWHIITTKAQSRLNRLQKIGTCNTIYIGSAGTYTNSKNTLRNRYNEFAGRHTIMFPLWALLLHGWQLDYGWKAVDGASQFEAHLKSAYRQHHHEHLPALIVR